MYPAPKMLMAIIVPKAGSGEFIKDGVGKVVASFQSSPHRHTARPYTRIDITTS